MLCLLASCSESPAPQPGGDGGNPGVTVLGDAGSVLRVEAPLASVSVEGAVLTPQGRPLPGASVCIGAACVTSGADGTFAIDHAPGQATLTAAMAGRLSLTRELGLVRHTPPVVLTLLPRAAPVMVGGASAVTVDAGEAALVVPGAAFPPGTALSATFVPARELASKTNDVAFYVDEDAGSAMRVRAILDVDVAVQPSSPVTLRLPVPAGVAGEALRVRSMSDAGAGPLTAPTSVAGGFAEFALTHFSDTQELEPVDGCVVTESSGDVSVKLSNGGLLQVDVGDVLPSGSRIVTTGAANVGVMHPNGSHVSSVNTAEMGLEGGPRELVVIPFGDQCRLIFSSTPRPMGKLRFTIRSRAAVMGVRGTVFEAGTRRCGDRDIADVDVTSGEVELTTAEGDVVPVSQGQAASVCKGCLPGTTTCRCGPGNPCTLWLPAMTLAHVSRGESASLGIFDRAGQGVRGDEVPVSWSLNPPGILRGVPKRDPLDGDHVIDLNDALHIGVTRVVASAPWAQPAVMQSHVTCGAYVCTACDGGYSMCASPQGCELGGRIACD